MHRDIAEVLHKEQLEIDYPLGLERVPALVKGRSFFPGGRGVYQADGERASPPVPTRQVMIVGRDFDTKQNHAAAVSRGEEIADGTWRNLIALLREAQIPLTSCFYTNAFMGLRVGEMGTSNMGKVTGHADPTFVRACQRFFLRQLDLVQPRLILCLGTAAPAFMMSCGDLPACWDKKSLIEIDRSPSGPLLANIQFFGDTRLVSTLAILVHPSLRPPNVRRRSYRGLSGHEAEVALLGDAVEHIGGVSTLQC